MYWKAISNTYVTACLLATFCLSIYSISRYFENEDIIAMKITRFHVSDDAIYPSFSFCIINPFLEMNFEIYSDHEINRTSYVNFLEGKLWKEKMMVVDYDNVTVSLSNNILAGYVKPYSSKSLSWNPEIYVSFRSSYRKCFTIISPEIGQKNLDYFGVYIKNDIFPNGKRTKGSNFYAYVHYPGQRFISYHTIKWLWDVKRNETEKYVMYFQIKNVDVIQRRNKPFEPCLENWKDHDNYIMTEMMKKMGCRPPHWISNSTSYLDVCQNGEKMQSFAWQPNSDDIAAFDPPCRMIERLDYLYEEFDEKDGFYGRLQVNFGNASYFIIQQSYRQIAFNEKIQKKAYTLDDVVGTVGGFIGLFLGYALIQVPDLIGRLFSLFRNSIKQIS